MRAKLLAAGFVFAAQAFAAEYAILATGFELRIDRHQRQGDRILLYSNGGVTEMPAAAVLRVVPGEAAPVQAAAPPTQELTPRELVDQAAERYGLPAKLVHSIARAESGYRQDAVSVKGAVGIMQLMPGTARILGADPNDTAQNVDAGARYLHELLLKYQDDEYQVRKALAAYNAGPGAVDRYNGVPPYRETLQYVERVIKQSGLRKPVPTPESR